MTTNLIGLKKLGYVEMSDRVDSDKSNAAASSKAVSILNNLLISQNLQEKRFLQSPSLNSPFLLIMPYTSIILKVNEDLHYFYTKDIYKINIASSIDVGDMLQPGKDYSVYICWSNSDFTFKISLNSNFPEGFTTTSSQKIGGFHTLCKNVGILSDNDLTGLVSGKIIPNSVWCTTHKPVSCSPFGMTYVDPMNIWVDIYPTTSGNFATASKYNEIISKNKTLSYYMNDLACVGKRLPTIQEFSCFSQGSNINSGASENYETAGGHSDSEGRRMISNYGVEDCCGLGWQVIDHISGTGNMNSIIVENMTGQGNFLNKFCFTAVGGSYLDAENSGPQALKLYSLDYYGADLMCRGCCNNI